METEFIESGTYNTEQDYCYTLFEHKALICRLNTAQIFSELGQKHCSTVVQPPLPPGNQHKKDMFASKHTFIVLSHFNLLGPGMTYSKVFAGGASTTPTAL